MAKWMSAGLVVGLVVMVSGCGESSDAVPAPVTEVATMTVTSTVARERDWTRRVPAQGLIEAWEKADISSRLGGQPVVEIMADVGDTVTAGQVLIKLDLATVNNDLAQARAAVAEAEAALDEANTNFRRTEKLKADKLISEQDALASKTRASAAAARLKSAQAALALQELRVEYTTIRAPDDGVISEKHVALGQVPQPGERLFGLIRQNRLEWRAEVLPEQLPQLSVGQSARVTLEDGSELNGTIRRISPALKENTRLGIVYVDLERGSTARAGMFVTGDIMLETYQALALPEAAMVLREGRTYVFTLDGQRRVSARRVDSGQRQDGLVEILSGVEPGAEVVIGGAGFLSDGLLVSVNNATVEGGAQ